MADSALLDAVLEIKNSENAAARFYAESAANMINPLGKRLFGQLEQFERYHYLKISSLEENLRLKQAFIKYERQEVPSTPRQAVADNLLAEQENVAAVLAQAIEQEIRAEKIYRELADRITDADGHYMFSRLSEEEHLHFHILKETLWNLSHNGSWEWANR